MKVLIDTNVILDFFINREPFATDAEKIFSLCKLNKIKGFISPITISNSYYILRKLGSNKKVINNLNQLLLMTEVLSMNQTVIENALMSGFKDFEDALQYYTATNFGKIDVLITRNTKDFKHSTIAVMEPNLFLKSCFKA